MHAVRPLIVLFLLASTSTAQAQSDVANASAARDAVQRSLPFLEREGVAWMNEKHCASCHNVSFMIWSHNAARAHGIAVDEKKVAQWTDWTWKFSRTRREWFKLTKASLDAEPRLALPADVRTKLDPLIDKPFSTDQEFLAALGAALTPVEMGEHKSALLKRAARPCEFTNDGGGLDTLSQLLLGRTDDRQKDAAFDADLRDLMLRWQQPNGSWNAAGQLPAQNRPRDETNAVTTMWAVLALSRVEPSGAPFKRALNFLKAAEPGQSSESLVVALLLERKFGQDERANSLLNRLLGQQNSDGGWAWRPPGASDAFATGQALYALSRCDEAPAKDATARARAYLIESQTADGSWSVPSRAISSATNHGRLDRLAPIYRYWGTAWASIGLSQTLPDAAAH
jgi:hypothetical protein